MDTFTDMKNRFAAAVVAGALGGGVLRALVSVRNPALGHPPPYAARRIAHRLVSRFLRRDLSKQEARDWAWTMRAVYGPMLGLAWSVARPSVARWPLVPRGLLLGLGVLAFEHLAFPLLRATAPMNTWTGEEHAWLVAQTAVFGVATEASLRALATR
ncbi:hypothetical protein D7Y13_34120 [Corallococcus praedator]|uniref:DUF1440 domain-containing protein n=2 Tax=Myxococcaceae TaxID=31 RepID=A0ABX9Q7K9_9BACT|nr:hypothetical protein D7X75_19425 [Corallococcus sp. CA031C]RKH93721.1 hypothetical protein D7Y13_34120 [Corallococcus praedator]